ncbi:MAG: DUF1365 domain-containing protein [Hyphomicrobiaceae bacterium]|nr:DUF1365 domain-containing protein [Hyphomicrobiaceae bacterium]
MSLAIPTTLAGNGPMPDAPASLYVGLVMHARMKPVAHRFSYKVFNLLIDLDRLGDAGRLSWAFGVDRPGLISFHQRDHGAGRAGRRDATLRDHVDRLLAAAGVARPARVRLLAYPRVFGFVFNPISVYFADDADGRPLALIYEVRNTFGEMHTYVAPLQPGDLGPEGIRQERAKLFYVSPFVDMDARYRFRILPPGEGVRLRILETDADGPLLAASFAGARAALSTATIARLLIRLPLLTLKVVAGIHWEAARLWFKGVRFFHRPKHPGSASIGGRVLPTVAPDFAEADAAR